MITSKHTGEDNAWRVFQGGHYGWVWTNHRGVTSAKHYLNEEAARRDMEAAQRFFKQVAISQPVVSENS